MAALAIQAAGRAVWEETTFRPNVAASVADEERSRNAIGIPRDVTAGWIVQADLSAAERVVAAGLQVDDEAVSGGGVADRVDHWVRCQCASAQRGLNTDEVPLHQAAEIVERAHCIAACSVVAIRRRVDNAAR